MALFPGRHRFQVGPSTFTLQMDADGWWWVVEVYWQMRRDGDQEDVCETHGPFTLPEAERTIKRLRAEQERQS